MNGGGLNPDMHVSLNDAGDFESMVPRDHTAALPCYRRLI